MPSTSHTRTSSKSLKRTSSVVEDTSRSSPYSAPSNDNNSWYYPSRGHAEDDGELAIGAKDGNWGNKHLKGSRWVRKGKMVAWGPGMDDWEAEERARKRIRTLLPQSKPARSPSPPSLPHLRSPSPPPTGPYPHPGQSHLSYTSFVLDKAVTQAFRSRLLDDLDRATNGFVQAEASLKKALGRLWQAMSEDPDRIFPPTPPTGINGDGHERGGAPVVPKREEADDEPDEDEEEREREQRIARAPDLTPSVHKIFLFPPAPLPPNNADGNAAPPTSSTPLETQLELLEKSLAALREFQDDGREYVERLEEIRDGLGDVRSKRDDVWDLVRRKALHELQATTRSMAG